MPWPTSLWVSGELSFGQQELGDSTVEVAVINSGAGIPDEKISGIFETFYTTNERGTGLGLSIARTIVESYGGKIWAENCTEGGAAFHFTIPLSAARPARPHAQSEMKKVEAATAA